ncbi:MAG: hypothetical protein J5I50_07690 [Chitinophagaceae bacterium]|nr:hypothetical protein [Chitinophagaceae bacterium]
MMKPSSALIMIMSALLLFSCNTENSKGDKPELNKEVSSASKNTSGVDAADFKGRLDELLTLDMAAKVTGFDKAKATKDYENKTAGFMGDKDAPPRECNYLWKNGRTITLTVGGKTVHPAYDDKVGIHSVSNTTLERFKRNYPVLSDEEKEAAAKEFEKQIIENQPELTNTEAGREVTETGAGLIRNLDPEEITGVGQAAVWYPKINELKVSYQGLTFALVMDISEDKNLNEEKCIELAKMIIDEKLQ